MSIFSRRLNKTPLGIYVHIPFCKSKCQYCDFYSLACKDDGLMDSYLDAVCAHIKEAGALAPGYKVDTIYFGGGTPSYFGGDAIAIIMTAIRRNFDVAMDAEITFEANPDSVTDKLLRRMRAEGFNRVSLGVQDDHDEMLKKLGRPHTYAQTVAAFQRIRKAGFRNVSLDLMYGLPGQTLQDWQETLTNVLRMNPEHFSCYGLKIEEGTPFYEMKDLLNLPDDDTAAHIFQVAVKVAKALKEGLNLEGLNIVQNNGEIAGQTVFHFHMHIIPRYKGDTVNVGWKPGEVTDEEIEKIKSLVCPRLK